MLIYLEPGSINKDVVAKLVAALHEELVGPIILIWDRLPAHKNTLVKDQVGHYKDWQIEHLPGYAPELNPVGYLWSILKGKDLANFCSNALWQIEEKIEQVTCRISSELDIIRELLKASSLYDAQH